MGFLEHTTTEFQNSDDLFKNLLFQKLTNVKEITLLKAIKFLKVTS